MGNQSTILSRDLEQFYLENPTGQMKFATLGFEYVMDFDQMEQVNRQVQTKRRVRRRPLFVTPQMVKERRRR